MAKIRKGVAYRRIERPYTRKSKYQKKAFVKALPANRIVRYNMGEANKTFPLNFELQIKREGQLRHNCLEAARLTAIRHLEKKIGKTGFYFQLMVYPHHVLRENPLASGAGADRMSTGMQRSFGKTIGLAAQVRKDQAIFKVCTESVSEKIALEALHRASYKLPFGCSIKKV